MDNPVEITCDPASSIWQISGDLVLTTVMAALKHSEILERAKPCSAIACQKIHRVDSAGLALFCEWFKWAAARGVTLRLIDPPDYLTRMMKLHGISELFS